MNAPLGAGHITRQLRLAPQTDIVAQNKPCPPFHCSLPKLCLPIHCLHASTDVPLGLANHALELGPHPEQAEPGGRRAVGQCGRAWQIWQGQTLSSGASGMVCAPCMSTMEDACYLLCSRFLTFHHPLRSEQGMVALLPPRSCSLQQDLGRFCGVAAVMKLQQHGSLAAKLPIDCNLSKAG